MKKVSSQQIERIFEFTSAHYVEYYDVQIELVDHLANAIEHEWESNPDKDFETLLQKEFKQFGVFGFMEILESKQRAMEKKYYKILLKEFLGLLNMESLFLSLAVVALVSFSLYKFPASFLVLSVFYVFLAFASLIFISIKNRKFRKKAKAGTKIFLLDQLIMNFGSAGICLYLPVYVIQFIDSTEVQISGNILLCLAIATIFVLINAFVYCSLFVLPAKRELILEKEYPKLI